MNAKAVGAFVFGWVLGIFTGIWLDFAEQVLP